MSKDLQIICDIAEGKNLKTIADEWGKSIKTIQWRWAKARDKYHLRHYVDACRYAIKEHLISI